MHWILLFLMMLFPDASRPVLKERAKVLQREYGHTLVVYAKNCVQHKDECFD